MIKGFSLFYFDLIESAQTEEMIQKKNLLEVIEEIKLIL